MNRLLYHKIQSGQISPEYLHEYKSLLKAQNGLGNVLPIYKNRDAFFDRNEDRGFYWKGNSLIYDCKEGEQCTARANRAVNSMVPGTTYFDWSENSKRKLGADFSTTEMPSLEQVRRYPYLEGDTQFGSLDAWDIPVTAEAKDPNLVLFRAKIPDERISFNQYMSQYAHDTPIGSYLNLGMTEKGGKYRGGSHTVRVVGYLENGEPLVADYGKIVPLSKALYVKESPDAREIAAIVKVPGKEKYSFKYFTGLNDMANTPNTEPYITDFNNLPLFSDKGKASSVKGSSEFKTFHDALVRDKNYLRAMTGLDSDIYDRYAKIALTLGGKETAYGTGSVYRYLDWLGKSQGISQLTPENVSEKYKGVLSKYKKGSNSYDAAATLLYLKELDNYKENWHKHGQKAQERPYVIQDEETLKNMVRGLQGAEQQGYIESSFGRPDVFRADGKEIELPYRQVWQDRADYEKEVNDHLKSLGQSGLRFAYDKNNRPVIYKKTAGNTIPNTIEDMAFYGWQSPNSVYYGDAQGDSKYYKGNKEIYNSLFGEMKYGGPKQPPLDKPWYSKLYNFVGNDIFDKYLGVDWFPNEEEPKVVTPKDSRAELIKKNQELNRVMKALIAYNHGPTATVEKLNKLKAQGHDIYNSTDWVNHFPDTEARNYALYIAKKADNKFNRDYEASLEKIPYYSIYDDYDYGDNSVPVEYFKRQMFKESSGDPKAYSSGHAAGLGQQKTIGVDEFNRLFGSKYTYNDRYDPEKSAEMQIRLMNYFYNRPWAIGANNKKRDGGSINSLPRFQGDVDPSQVMKYDPETDTYESRYSLPEVTITGKAPRDSFGRRMTPEQLAFNQRIHNAQGQALSNLMRFTASGPQQAMMYGLTGKAQYPSEAMGIENPYGAFAVDMVTDPLVAGSLIKAGAKGLMNLRYSPAPGMMFRGIGEEGFKDAVESGLFRSKQNIVPEYYPGTGLQINKSFGTNPYFTPYFATAKSYGSKYLAEVPRSAANWKRRYGRKEWSQVADRPIPITEGRILKKDWLRGYTPVEIPSKADGGPIVDLRGQWAHPGKHTIVPTPNGRITMQGVPYPVYGQDETGYGQMMFPGAEYTFPGQIVYEKPIMSTGGQHGGLDRWFAEKWIDVKTGKPCGRQEGEDRSYPACRPSRRVSSQTPKTSSEMSPAEKAKFKRVKTSSQRIPYNHKRNS